MTDAEKIDVATQAIRYTLDRAQTDADLGYLVGPCTEVFRLLCEAEAALTGQPLKTVEAERGKSHSRYPRRYMSEGEWATRKEA